MSYDFMYMYVLLIEQSWLNGYDLWLMWVADDIWKGNISPLVLHKSPILQLGVSELLNMVNAECCVCWLITWR